MESDPSPESGADIKPIPYATPEPKKGLSAMDALVLTVFCVSVAGVVIFFLGGASWPATGAVGVLGIVAIAFGHFLTRRPL